MSLVSFQDLPSDHFFDLCSNPPKGIRNIVHSFSVQEIAILCETGTLASQLSELSVFNRSLGDELAHALADVDFRSLTSLELMACQLSESAGKNLMGANFIRHLKHLNLTGNKIGDVVLTELCKLDCEPLESLILRDTSCGNRGAQAAFFDSRFPNLRKLDLSRNSDIDDTVFVANAESEIRVKLKELDVSSTRVGDQGVEQLGKARRLHSLTLIELETNRLSPSLLENQYAKWNTLVLPSRNPITPDELSSLAVSKRFSAIQDLSVNVETNQESASALREFAHGAIGGTLRRLNVRCQSGALLVNLFVGNVEWLRLRHLTVSTDESTQEIIEAILSSTGLGRLWELSLPSLSLTDRLVDIFIANNSFPNLVHFDVGLGDCSLDAVRRLANSQHSSQLEQIRVEKSAHCDIFLQSKELNDELRKNIELAKRFA